MAQRARIRRTHRPGPRVRRAARATVPGARGAARREQEPAGGLTIGGAQDPAEKAADRTADRVMRMTGPAGLVRRECVECGEENEAKRKPAEAEEEQVRRKPASAAAPAAPGAASARASAGQARALGALGGGKALASAERAFFEPRFGADLSMVRVHDGEAADRASKAIDARAFTIGQDVGFARGEYAPGTDSGRRLMAHELAHVVEDGGGAPRIRRSFAKCTGASDEDSIVTSHTLKSASIAKPGDSAEIKLEFGCKPRSFTSEIVDSSDQVLVADEKTIWNGKFSPSTAGEWTTSWDGKKGFARVGTYMVDDGKYRHRISDVAYAPGAKSDKVAKGGGVLSTSPEITVSTRGDVMSKRNLTAKEQAALVAKAPDDRKESVKAAARTQQKDESQHLFDATGNVKQANVDTLADAIKTEAGDYSDAEKRAVAWSIRNEMVRINSYSVDEAKTAFSFATKKTGGAAEKAMATDILSKKMADDPTSGSIKWYSPKSMPPNNKSAVCKPKGDYDCSGGTVTLTDGTKKSSMAPGFASHMTFVPLAGVTQWNFRFYKL